MAFTERAATEVEPQDEGKEILLTAEEPPGALGEEGLQEDAGPGPRPLKTTQDDGQADEAGELSARLIDERKEQLAAPAPVMDLGLTDLDLQLPE
eukprot:m.104514 g.104514  ORF g.104514 m.104514 type:complete len:95 (+) comp51599_c0_seq1:375-659(+)